MTLKTIHNILLILGGIIMVEGILCLSFDIPQYFGFGLLITSFLPILIALRINTKIKNK